MKYIHYISLTLCAVIFIATVVEARDFRQKSFIKTPKTQSEKTVMGEMQGRTLSKPVQLDRALIRKSYQQIFDAWGKPELGKIISENFQNKRQLLDAIATGVPLNAQIKMIAMDSVRVLSQKKLDVDGRIASIVTAEITTLVTYQDAQLGYQQIEGTGEYIIEIVTKGHDL